VDKLGTFIESPLKLTFFTSVFLNADKSCEDHNMKSFVGMNSSYILLILIVCLIVKMRAVKVRAGGGQIKDTPSYKLTTNYNMSSSAGLIS
jgi:hypothetical protein